MFVPVSMAGEPASRAMGLGGAAVIRQHTEIGILPDDIAVRAVGQPAGVAAVFDQVVGKRRRSARLKNWHNPHRSRCWRSGYSSASGCCCSR